MATTLPTATATLTHLRDHRAHRYHSCVSTHLLNPHVSGSFIGRDESSNVPASHPRGQGQVKTRHIVKHHVITIKHQTYCSYEQALLVIASLYFFGISFYCFKQFFWIFCKVQFFLQIFSPIAQLAETTWPQGHKVCLAVRKSAQNYPQLSCLHKIFMFCFIGHVKFHRHEGVSYYKKSSGIKLFCGPGFMALCVMSLLKAYIIISSSQLSENFSLPSS